jgi:hypothetical protein
MPGSLPERRIFKLELEAALDEIAQVLLVGVDASFPCEGWPIVLEHKLRIEGLREEMPRRPEEHINRISELSMNNPSLF